MKLIVHQRENDRLLALKKDGRFVEFDRDVSENEAIVGAVYCGRVMRVTADYALLDIDRQRPAFLQNPLGAKEGELLLVQVKREELDDIGESIHGTLKKGLVVTKTINIVTPYFVYNPKGNGIEFAKTVKDQSRLNTLGTKFLESNPGQFIFRSKAEMATEENLLASMELMEKTWSMAKIIAKKPAFLLAGRRQLERLLDTYSPKEIYTDSIHAYWDIQGYLATYPFPTETFNKQHNVFEEFGVMEEWENMISPWIKTPSGGNITIETTSTFTCIDVNQGGSKFSLEEINREVMKMLPEIVLKIQLNGNIIVDFAGNPSKILKEEIFQFLQQKMPKDASYLSWSGMGWLEIRRPRVRNSLIETLKKQNVASA